MKRATILPLVAFGGLALLAGQAHSLQAGDWVVRGGAHYVSPASDNGELDNGGPEIEVTGNYRPSISITRMMTDNVGVELLGAAPFRHDIRLDGIGKVASTKHLPPTLSVQYQFSPAADLRPFVGLGLNYTNFFSTNTRGALSDSRMKLDDSWGLAVQAGIEMKIDESWSVGVEARYIQIESDVKVDGDKVATAEINPMAYGAFIGYRF